MTARAIAARCFSPPESTWGRVHTVAEPNPVQQIGHVLLVVRDALAGDAQRQGHVFPRRQVIEQPEILEHDADAPAQLGALGRRHVADVLSQHVDLAAGRLHRHE